MNINRGLPITSILSSLALTMILAGKYLIRMLALGVKTLLTERFGQLTLLALSIGFAVIILTTPNEVGEPDEYTEEQRIEHTDTQVYNSEFRP